MDIEIITTLNETSKETGFGFHNACTFVMQSLLGAKHNAIVTVCINESDLYAVVKRKPSLVMLGVKYIAIENGDFIWLSEYFEKHGVSYTGSQKKTLSYDSNKVLAKEKVTSAGINTADSFTTTLYDHESTSNLPLPFPLFIKPIDSANGNGVDVDSVTYDVKGYQKKLGQLYGYGFEIALVEEYLSGKEFTVAIIENHGKLIIAAVEIIAPAENGIRILGKDVKTNNTETLKKITDSNILFRVKEIAEQSFFALGVRDFGRIDIKMSHNEECYFIEANLVPGMKRGSSYFPQACQIDAGLNYDAVLQHMIQGAAERIV